MQTIIVSEWIESPERSKKKHRKKTYNTRDSLVVTHPTTSLAVTGLSMGERTGSRIFQCLWSYVISLARIWCFVDVDAPGELRVGARVRVIY